jgi:hypothetical protein
MPSLVPTSGAPRDEDGVTAKVRGFDDRVGLTPRPPAAAAHRRPAQKTRSADHALRPDFNRKRSAAARSFGSPSRRGLPCARLRSRPLRTLTYPANRAWCPVDNERGWQGHEPNGLAHEKPRPMGTTGRGFAKGGCAELHGTAAVNSAGDF